MGSPGRGKLPVGRRLLRSSFYYNDLFGTGERQQKGKGVLQRLRLPPQLHTYGNLGGLRYGSIGGDSHKVVGGGG